MTRRALLALSGVVLAWLVLPAVPAAAGGGCHTEVTQGTGDVVGMRDACFTPTILWVEPGTTVTFSNEDPMPHDVSANGWGHLDPMDQGDDFSATFEEPGIYPFACMYHPGMTGAVVVGNGKGGGNGGFVTVEPLAVPEAAEEPETAPIAASQPVPNPEGSSALPWVAAGGLGTLLGGGAGLLLGRRRRTG